MATTPTIYGPAALDDLKERTGYEVYMLDEAFDLTSQWAAEKFVHEVIGWRDMAGIRYESGHTTYASRDAQIKAQFRILGAPLFFVTAFKLLDMVIEWGVGVNGRPVPIQFDKKLQEWAPTKGLVLPPALISAPWLKDTLLALFSVLYDYRSVIIHRKTYQYSGGVLHIVHEKKSPGIPPTHIDISDAELARLAEFAVCLVQVLQRGGVLDAEEERRLQICSDKLASLHGLPLFGARRLQHARMTFMVTSEKMNPAVDAETLRREVERYFAGWNVEHELLVCFTGPNGDEAYKLAHDQFMLCPSAIDMQYLRSHGTAAQFSGLAKRWLKEPAPNE